MPTPSVLETRIGSLKPHFFKSNKPPKPPNFPIEPLFEVVSVIFEISDISLLPSSMSTPESLYVIRFVIIFFNFYMLLQCISYDF